METKEKPFNLFRFEDLRIYHKATDYVKWIYSNTKDFPQEHKDLLAKPFIEAATKIAVNIAEGSGRNKSQFIYFLKLAKSNIRECVVLSSLSHQLNLFSIEKEEESRNFLVEISKMLGALISSLIRSKRPDDEDDDELPVSSNIDPNMY